MMRPLQTKPYALDDEEGQSLQSLGALVSVKATSEQTGGVFNLFEVSCPPGYATPLHIHYAEDVAVYVLEGALTFFWGSEKKEAVAGSYFFQPRGTPHGFRVEGDNTGADSIHDHPRGFRSVRDRTGTASSKMLSLQTAAARYKIEILGPLPE